MKTDEMTPEERKAAVRAARGLGYYQADIARAIGITPDHLSKLLRRNSRRSKYLAILDEWLRHNVLKENVFIPLDPGFATNQGRIPGLEYTLFKGITKEEANRLGLEIRAYFSRNPHIFKVLENAKSIILEPAAPPEMVPANIELYYYMLITHLSDVANPLACVGAIRETDSIRIDINMDAASIADWKKDSVEK